MKPTNENPLVKENRILAVSLSIAQAWARFFLKAYDALLHHDINYRSLPSYKDPKKLLDITMDRNTSLETGQAAALEYLENMESDIEATVARKGFKEV